jgi:hypothetical protein
LYDCLSDCAINTLILNPGLDLIVDQTGEPRAITVLVGGEVMAVTVNGQPITRGNEEFDAYYPTLATGPRGTLVAVWQAELYENGVRRLYTASHPAATKRYYAPSSGLGHGGGQQVALRVEGELYYTLPGPTGTSLLLVNENGQEAGHILYNAYGGVLDSSDLSPELKEALAGQGSVADPTTGLVHLGGGRWYDPGWGGRCSRIRWAGRRVYRRR